MFSTGSAVQPATLPVPRQLIRMRPGSPVISPPSERLHAYEIDRRRQARTRPRAGAGMIPPAAARPVSEEAVVAAYAAGQPVPAIAAWYGIAEADVHRMVGGGMPRRPKRRGPLIAVIIAASAVATVALIATAVMLWTIAVKPSKADQLQSAKTMCSANDDGIRIADGGATLLYDGWGDEDSDGASLATLQCLLNVLKVPTAVDSHMKSTRALDGRQEDAWAGFTASWTYHPDSGLELIVRTA